MRGFQAPSIDLTEKMKEILKKFSTSYTLPSCIVLRSRILLMASEGENNTRIAQILGVSRNTVNTWRKRFHENIDLIRQTEDTSCNPGKEETLRQFLETFLSDSPRPGKPPVFTPEQIMLINELACKNPKDFGYELSHWSLTALAQEAVHQGIVASISPSCVHRFLKFGGIEPWKNRYWLNSPEKHEDPETFKKN